jgi:hypothetical protein
MFEGDSADMCAGKFLLVSMGGRAEGLACADPGARTPISASGILIRNLLLSLREKKYHLFCSPSVLIKCVAIICNLKG